MPRNGKTAHRRSVLITGAASGIGAALSRKFCEEGYDVIGLGRSLSNLVSLGKTIGASKGSFLPVRCDLRSEKSIRHAVKTILQNQGRVDILVNNAGVTYFLDVMKTSVKQFDEVMDTNLRGMFLLTKALLPSMIRKRRGVLVNVLSYAAKKIYTGSGIYSASKSAAEAMMNVLREEIREHNIKVVNVYPGATITPMWSPQHRARYERRMMKTEEVASVIVAAVQTPQSMMMEEIVFRPQQGDLQV